MAEHYTKVDDIETVCTECYRIMPKRAPATCPTCGGKILRVPIGSGKQTVRLLKQRREAGNYDLTGLI